MKSVQLDVEWATRILDAWQYADILSEMNLWMDSVEGARNSSN